MDKLVETVALDSEEVNELMFKIRVEGTASGPAKVRLVCEAGDMSYMFVGKSTSEDGVVLFTVPQMSGRIAEGSYPAKVEVLIESRVFVPVEFNIDFQKATRVVAESISVVAKAAKPEITVSAVPMVVKKAPVTEARPLVIETPKPAPMATTPAVRSYAADAAAQPARKAGLKEAWEKRRREETVDVRELAKSLVKK